MTVSDAKNRVGNVWRLGHLLNWPLTDGQTLDFAFWRENRTTPALSVTPDGRGWFDHATGESGGMVEMLAKAEHLTERDACRRLTQLADGFTEAPPPIAQALRATPEQKRARWPASFGTLTTDEQFSLARRRRFPHFAGVAAASARGLLVSTASPDAGDWLPVRAWGVTDSARLAVQLRRLDGKLWTMPGGATPKSKSMPGSVAGWPIGISEVGDRANIVLTEGEPDLLAAITLHCLLNPRPDNGVPTDPRTFGFCCLTGGAKKISATALPMFAGKEVRIILPAPI